MTSRFHSLLGSHTAQLTGVFVLGAALVAAVSVPVATGAIHNRDREIHRVELTAGRAASDAAAQKGRADSAVSDAQAAAQQQLADATAKLDADYQAKNAKLDADYKAKNAKLDERSRQLDQRSKDLDAREAAISSAEATYKAGTIPGTGTYLVGSDVQPGTYRSTDNDSGCYYARLSSTNESDIIDNHLGGGTVVATISSGDVAFETDGCNDWHRV